MSGRKGTVLVPSRTSGSSSASSPAPTVFVLCDAIDGNGPGELFIGTDITNHAQVCGARTPTRVHGTIWEPCDTQDVIFDIKRNGVSIFTSLPHVAVGATTFTTDALVPGTWSDGDILSIDVIQVGGVLHRGRGLTVYIDYA